jgi:hypothetical protein
MKTYQDLLEAQAKGVDSLIAFVEGAINEHVGSSEYAIAVDAETYMRQQNSTIQSVRKYLYTLSGMAKVDNFSANYKCGSNYFRQNITQLNQYLLSNGVTFEQESTKERLGGATFDNVLSKASRYALVQGVSFVFFNLDHVEVFKLTEFKPLWDEEDGSLKAGIRFWRLAEDKPLRATLYTLDGYINLIKPKGEEMHFMDGYENGAKPYMTIVTKAKADPEAIYEGVNYEAFPIVPCYSNYERQSELVGKKENIDAYDLIKSGLANDIDDMQLIYWVLKNAGGMDEADLIKWRDSIRYRKVVKTEDDVEVDAHAMEVPYAARDALLKRLEQDIYNDAMALNTQELANGNVTATAINAAYERLNNRTDELEYCIIDFIQGLLKLIGIEDNPQFLRARLVNQLEEAQVITMLGDLLDDETKRAHISWLTPEERAIVTERLAQQDMGMLDEEETKIEDFNG